MSFFKFTFAVLLPVLLAGCSSHSPVAVFPGISHLDRVWQDDTGALYSALQNSGGEFVVHEPATGSFYFYRREHGADAIQSRPADAPAISRSGQALLLGEKTLRPAPVAAREVQFENRGVTFYGVLSVPRNREGKVPVIVNTHGSEQSSAVSADPAAAWYTDAGFATFIFDKRGTGRSGGSYTHDFDLLASDLEAAVARIAMDPDIDSGLIGVGGFSQGVFVATLAASRNKEISFLIAGYGVMEPPIREDFLETRLHFQANYPQADWQEFSALVLACEQAFALRDSSRWRDVSVYRRRWKGRIEPAALAGTLTGDGCLRWPPFALRLVGDSQFPPGLDWSFDPAPLMTELGIPVLFQYGEADEDAPPDTSVAMVRNWIDAGKPFTLFTYPGAVHGVYLLASDSSGRPYRYKSPEYIADLVRWLTALGGRFKLETRAGLP